MPRGKEDEETEQWPVREGGQETVVLEPKGRNGTGGGRTHSVKCCEESRSGRPDVPLGLSSGRSLTALIRAVWMGQRW